MSDKKYKKFSNYFANQLKSNLKSYFNNILDDRRAERDSDISSVISQGAWDETIDVEGSIENYNDWYDRETAPIRAEYNQGICFLNNLSKYQLDPDCDYVIDLYDFELCETRRKGDKMDISIRGQSRSAYRSYSDIELDTDVEPEILDYDERDYGDYFDSYLG